MEQGETSQAYFESLVLRQKTGLRIRVSLFSIEAHGIRAERRVPRRERHRRTHSEDDSVRAMTVQYNRAAYSVPVQRGGHILSDMVE